MTVLKMIHFQERKIDVTVLCDWQQEGNSSPDEFLEIIADDARKLKVSKNNFINVSKVFNAMMTENHYKEAISKKVHFFGWNFDTIDTIVKIINDLFLSERNITAEVYICTIILFQYCDNNLLSRTKNLHFIFSFSYFVMFTKLRPWQNLLLMSTLTNLKITTQDPDKRKFWII